jgi:hypothetical protein
MIMYTGMNAYLELVATNLLSEMMTRSLRVVENVMLMRIESQSILHFFVINTPQL